ncbi:YafY family transcriptional regulator [Clostridiaceae bacterium]|nr:YafY family transcriptional regulator [Clostridium sp.]NBI70681.1 YafY family transcriptional regulator [Clostridiaceae bacterium]
MKLDRLLGILSVLLQKETATAPELAEQFEVSRRTINRDIEALCRAGIPVMTRQGVGGGISIMDNYKINRTLLTSTEMRDILAGLRGLDSINGTNRYGQLMEKLSAGSSDFLTGGQSVLIDLSSWYKESLAPKIELLQQAIDSRLEVCFSYFSPNGESERTIEPFYLLFCWSSWYVWGFCRLRGDFRMFKLNRMDALRLSGRTFPARAVPLPGLGVGAEFPGALKARILFDAACKWRLVEEYGPDSFREQADGRLLFEHSFRDREYLMTWLMSFRDRALLLEPEDVRRELLEAVQKMREQYEGSGAISRPPAP